MAVVQGAILSVTVAVVLSMCWKGPPVVERDAGETEAGISIRLISGGDWLTNVEGGAEGEWGAEGAEGPRKAEVTGEAEGAGEEGT